jgi:hypothetical protein
MTDEEQAAEIARDSIAYAGGYELLVERITAALTAARAEALKPIKKLATMAINTTDPMVKEAALRGIRRLAQPQE